MQRFPSFNRDLVLPLGCCDKVFLWSHASILHLPKPLSNLDGNGGSCKVLQLHHRRNNQGNLKRNKLTASAQKGDCFWAVSITDVSTHQFFWLLKTSSSLWLASGCCTRFLHVSLLNSLGENTTTNIQTHDLFQELLESPSRKKINQKSVILSSTRKRASRESQEPKGVATHILKKAAKRSPGR